MSETEFTFTNEDGQDIQEVWSCTNCMFISTRPHFYTDGDVRCPLCNSPATKQTTLTQEQGMSDFQYRNILSWLQENRSGIGDATITHIQDEFPNGDEFIDACRHAYETADYDALTVIDGVGETKAKKKLVDGIAEHKNWDEDDAAIINFDL